jgi:hypothetical protein
MANQHVLKREDGWGVRREKASRDTVVVPTQKAAEKIAKQIATNQGGDVFVHRQTGSQWRERNTYGKTDHNPPRG